jgi:selT/selW/selH-like putative selenoprotein
VFEVEVDGNLVFSKKATGRHGEPDDILKKIRAGT